jgi:group I intron endonuclease
MKYIVYKITNNINGKIYIGVHKTKDIDDGYMGSGKILRRAIKKYGIKNFTKEVLNVFDNPEDMFDMESQLVNENFVRRTDTYNIRQGGFGGWDHIDSKGENNYFYGKPSPNGFSGKKHTDDTKKIISMANKGRKPTHGFKGLKHKSKSKEMIGVANSKHQLGKGNSNYGNCWVYNPILKKNKSIPRFDLDKWLNDGWIKGRKMKFN